MSYTIEKYPSSPATELTSVPTSIRQRLEHAQHLLNQNRPAEANAQFRTAEIELARTNPELAAVLCALRLGYRGVQVVNHERKTFMQRIEHRFFGILLGESWEPHTKETTTTRTVRFF